MLTPIEQGQGRPARITRWTPRWGRQAAVAAVVASLAVVAACGGGGQSATEDGPVTLRMAWYGGEARADKYNAILDRFEEQNPDITVSREAAEYGAYWERVGTQAAARDLPDVMHFTNQQLREFSENGQLLELDEAAQNGQLDISSFDESLIESGRVDGTLYAVPTGILILSTVVNTTMMEEAGVTLPGPGASWTWDDFMEQGLVAAKNLDEGSYFTSDFGSSTRILKAFVMARDKQLFDLEQDPPVLGFERQDLVDWLTMWETLRQEGVAPPASVSAEQSGLPFEDLMFSRDETGIFLHTTNTLTNHEAYTEGDLELRRLPVDTADGPAADYYFSVTMAVAAGSDHPEEATQLINYFMNDPEATEMYGSEFGPPAATAAREAAREQETAEQRKVTDFTEELINVGVVSDQAWPRGGVLLNDGGLLARANEQVAFGEATPEEAADALIAEVESAMS